MNYSSRILTGDTPKKLKKLQVIKTTLKNTKMLEKVSTKVQTR